LDYRYISGDSHLEVDTALWTGRIPDKYKRWAPELRHLDGYDAYFIDGKLVRKAAPADLYAGKGRENYVPDGVRYEGTPGTGAPSQRLEEQTQDGVDAEVLFPAQATGPRVWRTVQDDEAYKSILHAYNDWLGEYCSYNPERLIGVGIMPAVDDVDAYIAELNHCKEVGLGAVMLMGFPAGETYPSPDDDRFFAAAQEMGMPVTVHVDIERPKTGSYLLYPKGTEEDRLHLEAPGRTLAEQVARFGPTRGSSGLVAIQWVLSGLFDRFPDLKILFAENQIGWIPFYLQGADTRYERNRYWAEEHLGFNPLARDPSEYLLEHTVWGFQYDRVGVEMRSLLNIDNLIWGSDFPHQESDWPYSMKILDKAFANAPDDVRYKMTCGNAINFFGLNAS
jgi:predicted TIM-barrel fold metal-dependent hydrolase